MSSLHICRNCAFVALVALSLAPFATSLQAQIPTPIVWFRADTLVTKSDSGFVESWKNMGSGGGEAVATGAARPIYAGSSIGGKPALIFNGTSTFMIAPSVFPVNADYTVYAVVKNTSVAGANNIVGGTSRTIWLNNSLAPRVLHNANFARQVSSSVTLPNGTGIIRVRYVQSTKTVSIHVDNAKGEEGTIPETGDPTLFIGAFASSNFFNGHISEILVFPTALSDNDITNIDQYLHTRYGIYRTPPPEPPLVLLTNPPRAFQIYPLAPLPKRKVDLSGITLVDGIDSVKIKRNYFGVTYSFGGPLNPNKGTSFKYEFVADTIQQDFEIYVRRNNVWTQVLNAPSVLAGVGIAVCGQSNSIFGGALEAYSIARTFGSNFQKSRSDTAFKLALCTGNGGDANIGAWPMQLARNLALYDKYPSLTINGGVGGTTIEQHYPDMDDRMNINTIYGSWLYRVEKSGMRSTLEHLFWYQGESNNGEGYADKFDKLYQAWHEDLPNLKHIYVIQIHTGCGGEGHALLRDMQRRFKDKYPDVEVHAASGLPGHDGCHFATDGYKALGDQMHRLLLRNQVSKVYDEDIESPNVRSVNYTNEAKTDVRITFRNVKRGISFTPNFDLAGRLRTPTEAFLVNDSVGKVSNVTTDGNDVILTLATAGSASFISYVPDRFYADTAVVFQGPWIQNQNGIGAMTFRVTVDGVSSVDDHPSSASSRRTGLVLHSGARVPWEGLHIWYALDGSVVSTGEQFVPNLTSGIYVADGRLVCVVP